MKKLTILTLLIATTAYADVDYGFTCFGETDDNCAVLIEKDRETGEVFSSAKGACIGLGHSGLSWSQGQNGIEGPYIIVNSEGKIVKTYPKDPSYVYRFRVITRLVCRD
jgi:hypothetical protein